MYKLVTPTHNFKLAPIVEIAAIYTQSDILVKTLDYAIKYEICWHCGFVLKT